ncbi:MAG: hypothetical protein LLG04_05920 [Parachlamydia sp.]|nr:hypothetical protein [Parachlamydia sp.]
MQASPAVNPSTPPPNVWGKNSKAHLFVEAPAAAPVPAAASVPKTNAKAVAVLAPAAASAPIPAAADPFSRISVSAEVLSADYEASRHEWEERSPMPMTARLAEDVVRSMRFSQASVSRETKGEMSLRDLQNSLSKGWDGLPLPVVRYKDGSYTSLGNRRLLACQKIIKKTGRLIVEAQIHEADARAPAQWIDRERTNYLDRLVRKARSPMPNFFKLIENQYEETIERHGINKGSYAELIFIRTRSDWNYNPKEGEAVYGYDLQPFLR